MSEVKRCSKCNKSQDITKYHVFTTGRVALMCNTCRTREQAYKASKRDARNAYNKKYYQEVTRPNLKALYERDKERILATSKRYEDRKKSAVVTIL